MYILIKSLSCTFIQGLRDALTNKKPALEEISDLADILRPEDGDKPSGTKDVDSRLIIYIY